MFVVYMTTSKRFCLSKGGGCFFPLWLDPCMAVAAFHSLAKTVLAICFEG